VTTILDAPTDVRFTDLALWPAPGVYRGIPAATYHALDACNASSLKTLVDKTPAHLQWERQQPKDTQALRDGEALHTCILEPERFDAEYEIITACAGTTGKGGACSNNGKIKAEGQWWCGTHAKGKAAETAKGVHQEHHDRLLALRIAVRDNISVRHLLWPEDRETELSLIWRDELTKVLCKARLDIYRPNDGIIADLKSTADASEDGFSRAIAQFNYHLQAAWYRRAAEVCLGNRIYTFKFVAIEAEPPFGVQLFKLHEGAMQFGQYLCDQTFEVYAHCVTNNRWPSYSQEMKVVDLPRYVYEKEKRRSGQM
jgi:exodeoxyribonuclease VIII